MNKKLKGFLIAIAVIVVLALLCVGISIQGNWTLFAVFVIYYLVPELVGISFACLLVSLILVIHLKRNGQAISSVLKWMLVISSVVFGCTFISLVVLIVVFSMSIPQM